GAQRGSDRTLQHETRVGLAVAPWESGSCGLNLFLNNLPGNLGRVRGSVLFKFTNDGCLSGAGASSDHDQIGIVDRHSMIRSLAQILSEEKGALAVRSWRKMTSRI